MGVIPRATSLCLNAPREYIYSEPSSYPLSVFLGPGGTVHVVSTWEQERLEGWVGGGGRKLQSGFAVLG